MTKFIALGPAVAAVLFFGRYASAAASLQLQTYIDANCKTPDGGPAWITEQCIRGGPRQGGSFTVNNMLIPGNCGVTLNFDNNPNCGLGAGGPPALTIDPNDWQCFQNPDGNLDYAGLFCN
ncbi:hypothetical protein ACSS6W_008058 [Trichoderma asperelloides]